MYFNSQKLYSIMYYGNANDLLRSVSKMHHFFWYFTISGKINSTYPHLAFRISQNKPE